MQENTIDEQAPANDDEAFATDEQAPGDTVTPQAEVALILPGVVIKSKAQAQMYLETEKMKAETEKIEAAKKISPENAAQRAHEVTMKDIRKLELQVELAKMQSQAPVQTTDTNEQPPPVTGPSGEECMGAEVRQQAGPTLPAKENGAAASADPTTAKEKDTAASAAPTPAQDNARSATKRKRKSSSCAKNKSAPATDTASTAAKPTSKCSSRAKDKSAHIKGQSTLSFPKQPRGVACERT